MTRRSSVLLAGSVFRPSSYEDVESAVKEHRLSGRSPLCLGYVNPHVITAARDFQVVDEYLARCDHVVVDGAGVWLPLALSGLRTEHCAGYEMAERLLASGAVRGDAVVVGIEAEHSEELGTSLQLNFPDLHVVELVNGFTSLDEVRSVLSRHPDVDAVLIGAGTPKSEAVLMAAAELCHRAVIANIGARTLSVYAGTRQHAPRFLYRAGLEWVYRFVREPHTRPRYLRGIPRYLRLLAASRPRVVKNEQEQT